MATAVVVPPPSKATEDEVMSEAGIAGWLIAVIAVACVLFILLLLFREGRVNRGSLAFIHLTFVLNKQT